MAEERRRSLFDWVEAQLSLPVVGGLIIFVFTLGEVRYRFEVMELQVAQLQIAMEEEEEKVALKEELATLENRLAKWIGRAEELQEHVRQLEIQIAALGSRDPDSN